MSERAKQVLLHLALIGFGAFLGGTAVCLFRGADTRIGGPPSIESSHMDHCESSGGTDDYVCTLSRPLVAYVVGVAVQMKADVANTGAATADLSALGAKSIVKNIRGVTYPLHSHDIRAGQIVTLVYDGTDLQMR